MHLLICAKGIREGKIRNRDQLPIGVSDERLERNVVVKLRGEQQFSGYIFSLALPFRTRVMFDIFK